MYSLGRSWWRGVSAWAVLRDDVSPRWRKRRPFCRETGTVAVSFARPDCTEIGYSFVWAKRNFVRTESYLVVSGPCSRPVVSRAVVLPRPLQRRKMPAMSSRKRLPKTSPHSTGSRAPAPTPNSARCPPSAEHVSESHGQLCSRAHTSIFTCPPSAARKNRVPRVPRTQSRAPAPTAARTRPGARPSSARTGHIPTRTPVRLGPSQPRERIRQTR